MSTERVIQHQQCPHTSLLACLDEKRMNYYFKYSFLLLLFIIQKTNKQKSYSADSLHETLSRCAISCNCPCCSFARRISADKQVPEKHCPCLVCKKSRKNRRSKREKPECILENSNKSTYKTIYVTVWPQQGRLYINLILRLQNGQLCFDVLAPGSIVGQEL